MNPTMRRFIKLLVRFQNAVDDMMETYDDIYERDREFDGGEFSGPAIQREIENEENRIARRFGFANAEVAYTIAHALHCTVRGMLPSSDVPW